MSLLYRALAGLGVLALAFGAGWLLRGHYAAQALAAEVARSNAQTAAAVAAWRSAVGRIEDKYLQEAQDAAAQAESTKTAIDTASGGDAPLDPFLAHAAGLLWPGTHP